MPNNIPQTAQKNNLSSWESLYTQLIFLNTIYLQTHTHSGTILGKKSILFIKSHPGNNLLGFLAIIQSSRHIQLCYTGWNGVTKHGFSEFQKWY